MCGNQSWMMDSHVWSRRKRGKKILSNERERILEIRTQTSWDELNFMANDYYPQFECVTTFTWDWGNWFFFFVSQHNSKGRESHKSFTFQSQWTSCLSKCKWCLVHFTSRFIQVIMNSPIVRRFKLGSKTICNHFTSFYYMSRVQLRQLFSCLWSYSRIFQALGGENWWVLIEFSH